MSECAGDWQRMHRYLDAELASHELLEFEKHLMECEACRSQYEELRVVSETVRGAKPLYDVPESSYRKARLLIEAIERRRRRVRWGTAAGAGLAAAIALTAIRWAPPLQFDDFAAATHRRYAGRAERLGIVSTDPRAVSAWLEPRLDFPLRLPDYPQETGRAKRYRLAGGSVLSHGGARVALISYEMEGRPISLLMTASGRAAPRGGETFRSGRLLFHFSEREGLHLIRWTDKSIHYTLVSELGGNGAESCAVCHGSAAERPLIEGLKSSRN